MRPDPPPYGPVRTFEHRVFFSFSELADLLHRDPAASAVIRRQLALDETEQIIAAHRRALLTRPRRRIPPALLPTLTPRRI